jgi:hypothetical protein
MSSDANSNSAANTPPAQSGGEGPVINGGAAGSAAAPAPFPKHLRPGRKWNLPKPSKYSNKFLWTLVGMSSLVMAILWIAFAELLMPTIDNDAPPPLGPEFKDQGSITRNYCALRPPLNWTVHDPHDDANVYFKGPKEKGFSPLIIESAEIAPGGIVSYIKEHKARILAQDKTVVFDEKEEDEDVIDGCRAHRLVYDVDLPSETDKAPDGSPMMVKVRTLQYIMEDRPRFYRITCHVRADQYRRFLSRFEASARSFKRLAIPQYEGSKIIIPISPEPAAGTTSTPKK